MMTTTTRDDSNGDDYDDDYNGEEYDVDDNGPHDENDQVHRNDNVIIIPTCAHPGLATLIIPAACFCCKYVIKPFFNALVCVCTSRGSRPHGKANNKQCSSSF